MKKSEKISKAKSPDTTKKRKKTESPGKAALEMLHQSEERYRTILENMQEGYFEVDLTGNVTFCNDSLCRIHKRSKDEMMRMNNRQYMDKETQKKVFEAFNRVYKTGEPLPEIDWQIIRKDGVTRYIEASVSLLKDSSGKPLGFRGITRDVTDRKKAEKKIQENERQYRLLTEKMSDIVWIADMNLRTSYISPSIKNVLGFSQEERMRQNLDEQLTPHSLSLVLEALSKEFALEKQGNADPNRTLKMELEYSHKDGSTRWMELLISGIRNDQGVLTGIHGVSREITERKQMEEKLRLEEQRFRAFVEHSSDMIVLVNLAGVIMYVNPAIESILGYKPEERIGAKGFEIVHPDDLQYSADKVIILFTDTNAPVVQFDLRLRHKDGSWRMLEAVGSNQVNNDVVEYIIINYRDITERKKVEETLKESEQKFRELSIIDDLTQIYNSRHFYAQLEREIERSNRYGHPLTLLLLDLDNFKTFNDAYGHVEGDHVLSRLGQVVKRCLRETDTAYRYGGEEFTIILPMTMSDEGIVIGERIQKELRKETFSPVSGQEVYVTVSIGVAQFKPKEEIKTFVHRVDHFMYQAKRNGRDRIYLE